MRKQIIFIILFIFFMSALVSSNTAFSASAAAEYLCELGVKYYRLGKSEDALMEFKRALLVDPLNQTAKDYIAAILQPSQAKPVQKEQSVPAEKTGGIKKQVIPLEAKKIKLNEIYEKEKILSENIKQAKKLKIGQEKKEPKINALLLKKNVPIKKEADFGKTNKENKKDSARKDIISSTLKKAEFVRKDVINQAMEKLEIIPQEKPAQKKEEVSLEEGLIKPDGITISGEAELRFGVSSDDHDIWKQANWDLNEKNWRMLSEDGLNQKENSFDPRIYDRMKIQLDTDEKTGLAFHTNIIVDPWSFVGKSNKVNVSSIWGDNADVELKYWSNSGYTIDQTILTNRSGNSFSLPELKVADGKTGAVVVNGAFTNETGQHDRFSIPSLEIEREFKPIREFWFAYNEENLKVKFFPIAYENQALTFNDPLRLSNNRIWWEDSPWIRRWSPGIENTGANPVDFSKGYWDNSLSFFTRDSEGQRLTSLRGLTFDFAPQEGTSFVIGLAAPKDLWQDYSQIDNLISATRAEHLLLDNLGLGAAFTSRLGFDTEQDHRTDAKNYVAAGDLKYEIEEGVMLSVEYARSKSYNDLSSTRFKTEADGNAYYVSLIGRYPNQKIINADSYNGIQAEDTEPFFHKMRLLLCRMDDSFDQPLSSYVETRDDESWSRHLHFREPFKYYYQGEGQLLTWDDIKGYSVGNGIDIGRSTIGLRVESLLWDKKVNNFFDVRNVHSSEGKFVENVTRDEVTWKTNDKLTTKVLGIYQKMPKTKGGVDPFIFDPLTRRFFDNTYIEDGKSASLTSGSLGMEYVFFDWLAVNGTWECTNDISLAYDNFPRGILNGGQRLAISYEDSNKYRDIANFLFNQQFFPRPPYPHYNIFKTGVKFNPFKELEFYLDYTRNAYEKAGQVDDNMNHVGFEVAYAPMSKFKIFLKYTYSRWQDIDRLIQGINSPLGHHNFFTEFMYNWSENENLVFQYGEASRDPYLSGILDIGWDPYGGSLRTIDTRHIFRLYYRRRF